MTICNWSSQGILFFFTKLGMLVSGQPTETQNSHICHQVHHAAVLVALSVPPSRGLQCQWPFSSDLCSCALRFSNRPRSTASSPEFSSWTVRAGFANGTAPLALPRPLWVWLASRRRLRLWLFPFNSCPFLEFHSHRYSIETADRWPKLLWTNSHLKLKFNRIKHYNTP